MRIIAVYKPTPHKNFCFPKKIQETEHFTLQWVIFLIQTRLLCRICISNMKKESNQCISFVFFCTFACVKTNKPQKRIIKMTKMVLWGVAVSHALLKATCFWWRWEEICVAVSCFHWYYWSTSSIDKEEFYLQLHPFYIYPYIHASYQLNHRSLSPSLSKELAGPFHLPPSINPPSSPVLLPHICQMSSHSASRFLVPFLVISSWSDSQYRLLNQVGQPYLRACCLSPSCLWLEDTVDVPGDAQVCESQVWGLLNANSEL